MANSEKVRPLVIADPDAGKEYTLEFNRRTVMKAEQAGLDINQIESKSMTMITLLFWGAFQMHHPYMTKEMTDKILFEGLGGLDDEELKRLGDLYAVPLQTLISSEEDQKQNPRKMVVRF